MTNREQLAEITGNELQENSTLVEVSPVENTPFSLVEANGQYFLALGKYRLTQPCDTKDEALEYLEREFWRVLMDVVIVLIESNKLYNSLNTEQKKTLDEPGN